MLIRYKQKDKKGVRVISTSPKTGVMHDYLFAFGEPVRITDKDIAEEILKNPDFEKADEKAKKGINRMEE